MGKKKTAMQQIIELMEREVSIAAMTPHIIQKAKELRDTTEKQDLIEAQQTKPWKMYPVAGKPGFYQTTDVSGETWYKETFPFQGIGE